MLTYPESMAPLDVDDPKKSFAILQAYIGYLCERTDFALRNMTRTVSEAGVSSVEVYVRVTALESGLSAAEGRIATVEGGLAALRSAVGDAGSGLTKAVADLRSAIGDETTPGSILYRLKALEDAQT